MRCIVTAGPTFESLDNVRRLTNFSTGRLGIELANFLTSKNHNVTLLVGQQATYCGKQNANVIRSFTTTSDLREQLRKLAGQHVDSVFHVAAVSDFAFGKIWKRSGSGKLSSIKAGKIPTRHGVLLAELTPTPKIIGELRRLFPAARVVGWKYETDGGRAEVIRKALKQIRENDADACVANGPAYGIGWGIIAADEKPFHFRNVKKLFAALEELALAKR